MATVCMVDIDDPFLEPELQRHGHTVTRGSLEALLKGGGGGSPDVGVVRPTSQPAVPAARQLAVLHPATAWVLLLPASAAGSSGEILDAGASDVAVEPLSPASAVVLVARLVREQRLKVRLSRLEGERAKQAQLEEVIGRSPAMRELLDKLGRLTRRSAQGPALSVMITGETGTGKGLLARVLHFSGRRRDGPFVELNCAAIPSGLLESELFGHERGAFTDARSSRIGLVEAAHGGTLFLDEVTYLPPEGQAKLLTVLETRRVRRLGGTAERQVEVQVVAASSHDLQRLVEEGRFTPELLHRLTALWLKLPPLRERGDDAVLMAERFLGRIAQTYRLPQKQLSEAAREAIRAHPWPGNVRELYHAIERAMLFEDREVVEPSDLALAAADGAARAGPFPPEGLAVIDHAERELIERALRVEKGNVTRAAALLKVSRDVLRTRIEKFGLVPASFGG
ncbi:MAG: sigma-54-dependent Fis family transcriptional regulator [Myxococcales bacterium]|nr:sigma-54-dependent Fis family transcriptional regulator [Myxococcales bacterium]